MKLRRLWPSALAGVLLACTSAGVSTPADQASTVREARSGLRKTLVIGQLTPIKDFGPWEFFSTAGGAVALSQLHTIGLVSLDVRGSLAPRVAAKLPSFEEGSIAILPDGRLRTTWALRPGVTWHDGVPFTADDVVFSWEVARYPELTTFSPGIWQAERVEAAGASTVVITWKTTFYRALHLGHMDLWLLPKHLLGSAFQGDKQLFRGLPYFSTEYAHLGPFRLVDFGMGEQQVFERFDDYFLGQARIDRIIIRTMADENVLLANLKAGAIDMAAEKTFSGDVALQLRDEWRPTGEGIVVVRQDNWLYMYLQFDPQWAQPLEISRDVRIRRGLLQATDREAIREFALPGIPDTSGETFMPKHDPRASLVGEPFARYRYDATRALEHLGDAGWRRAADGRLLAADGRHVRIEVRGDNSTWTKEVALIADLWRQVGIDAAELIPSRALVRDLEWRATFPAVVVRARGSAEGVFAVFDGRQQATEQTRWQGANFGHYANPAFDRLLDQLQGTLDERGQGLVLKETAELMANELPALPVYYRTSFGAMRKGIHALTTDYAETLDSVAVARTAHLWDRD